MTDAASMASRHPRRSDRRRRLLTLARSLGNGAVSVVTTLIGLAALTFFIGHLLPLDPVIGNAAAQRAAYVRYLLRRLEAPRLFVEEAERARRAA